MKQADSPVWSIVRLDDERMPIRSRSTTYAEAERRLDVLQSMGVDRLAIMTNFEAEKFDTNAANA